MATLILGAVGTAIGGSFGGTILGLSGAALGGMVGSAVGSMVDAAVVQSLTPGQRVESARLDSLRVTSSTEGAVIPRLFGRMRMGGNIIWATDFLERQTTTHEGGGKGGGGVTTTTYSYSASFAVALCEGPIAGIGRLWADGGPMDLTGVTYRVHLGTETQDPDTLIMAKMGADLAPAYRGTAYVVFENLALEKFGNRLPQITFEVIAPVDAEGDLESLVRSVALIPGAGEFAYATSVVTKTETGATTAENVHAVADTADVVVALDNLEQAAPNIEAVNLVSSWFGSDLRAGSCTIKPKVEVAAKVTSQVWSVDGVVRAAAGLVSESGGAPAYGGTPSDASIVESIAELKARGLRITFYPFVLMDIPAGNTLPNPYSNGAAGVGQSAYPWRGRITCSPAAGFTGTVDATATAATQIAAFFGSAAASDFAVAGTTVSFTGSPTEWGYRRMVLHYAKLCVAAGGVDSFLIASELRGITSTRSNVGYPGVAALKTLADDVKAIVGAGCKVGYAADWSEYNAHVPPGTTDLTFHLDPLWSASSIDFVGIDNYLPLSDWRDGSAHLDATISRSIYDPVYLVGNIEGGEYFDWYYASEGARTSQTRSAISDGAYGKPWVFRQKDFRNWWLNQHFNRVGGIEAGSPTAWVPQSKPIRFTEVGCPAIDRGANQPNVFVDAKSSEGAVPYFSRGFRDDAMQRAYLTAQLGFFAAPANNPTSAIYGQPMVDMSEAGIWTWDARPYPFFPALADAWGDAANWTVGHWITGRLGASDLGGLVRALCAQAGMLDQDIDVQSLSGQVEGFVITAIESPRTSLGVLMRHFGFDGTEADGKVRFVQRGLLPSLTLTPDDMIAADDEVGESFEMTRQQTTDLPQILKWQLMRSDEEFDPAPVEARRITALSRRTLMESFPLAVPPEEAQRRVERALMETWVGIESLIFGLPPSRMALDATDVVLFQHDGRETEFRVLTTAEENARRIESVRQDRFAYERAPGPPRSSSVTPPVAYGQPNAFFMDLPQLTSAVPDYQPYMVADASPWPGSLAVEKSPSGSGYTFVTGINRRAIVGVLATTFPAGPTDRWDDASVAVVDITYGTLASVGDDLVLAGQNALAVETASGVWEIFQAATATLVAPGRYSLSRLLRGQKGTEYAMGAPAPIGARVVFLDLAVTPIPTAASDVNLLSQWIVGPASKPISDPSYLPLSYAPAGAGLRPYSPVINAEPRDTPRTPGDLVITWLRRDRSLLADAWDIGDVPSSDLPLAFDLEIYDGAVLKRTILALGTETYTYLGADQITDLGALLDLGDTLNIRVYQVSSRVGRSPPCIHTLLF